ncbi:MAG: hypothetical protein SGCHY_001089 [Lobulomycetales sp.]
MLLLTFLQFLAVTLVSLPLQIDYSRWALKRRSIPISTWCMFVVLFYSSTVMTNYALNFHIPMPLHIVFRSCGVCVTMLLGWLINGTRYPSSQVIGVLILSIGIIIATLASSSKDSNSESSASSDYFIGIFLLTLAVIASSILGLLQQIVYGRYGSHNWKEGLFYTHALSLPLFLLGNFGHVKSLFHAVTSVYLSGGISALGDFSALNMPDLELLQFMAMNVFTQRVYGLSSSISAVALNLILSVRKFTSLMISVAFFNNTFGLWHSLGTAFVFAGSLLYAHGRGAAQRDSRGSGPRKSARLKKKAL